MLFPFLNFVQEENMSINVLRQTLAVLLVLFFAQGCFVFSKKTSENSKGLATAFQTTAKGSIGGVVRTLSASEALSLRFVSHGKILTWEGIVENIGKPNSQVHLIDTQVFNGHFVYTQKALGRGPSYKEDAFFSEIQFPNLRKYMPFLVFDFHTQPLLWKGKSYNWVMNVRRYNYKDTDAQLAQMLVGLKKQLSDAVMSGFGEPLLFVYDTPRSFRRPHTDHLADVRAAGFEVITEQDMIKSAGGQLVSVLNPGVAYGYLKLVKAGEVGERLTPRHIAVFEDTPERIPPVTGIVTLEPQTPLSHVNLLAKNRGTPNISTATLDLVPGLATNLDKIVKMEAKADGTIQFTQVPLAEAQAFWDSRATQKLEVPKISASSLEPVEFASSPALDLLLPNIGSKASNYATLQRLLETKFVQPGFALTFAHYLKISAEPATKQLIDNLLSQKNTLSPEAIDAQLLLIRQSIQEATSDAALLPTLTAIRAAIARMPGAPRIRLRSSTNSEDLPVFNGAGLYESAGFDVAEDNSKLKKKVLKVMASLWLERAFWERELFGIDHAKVGMAVLINEAFSNEFANGVVVGNKEQAGFKTWINSQVGEASVTNPLEGEVPEAFSFYDTDLQKVLSPFRSNLGEVFLKADLSGIKDNLKPQLLELQAITQKLHGHFVGIQQAEGDNRNYGIDIEFKLMQKGSEIKLFVKQSRLLNLETEASTGTGPIVKAVAKANGLGGAHLRTQPKQLAALGSPADFCLLLVNQTVGVKDVVDVGNGFVKATITNPSTTCPTFTGTAYLFATHFNFLSK